MSEELKAQEQKKLDFTHLNDTWNANYIVEQVKDELLYNEELDQWYSYNGSFWEQISIVNLKIKVSNVFNTLNSYIETIKVPERLSSTSADSDEVKDYENKIYEIEIKSYQKLIKVIKSWITKCGNDQTINSTIEVLKKFYHIKNDQLDKNILLLNFKNGTYDLSTLTFKEHDKLDYITNQIDCDYDPKATCDSWLKALQVWFPNNPNMIKYIQEVIGYTSTGLTGTRQMFFIFGASGTGKSTFINVISKLLGKYSKSIPKDTFMAKYNKSTPSELMSLQGVRMLHGNELDSSERWDSGFIKSWTGSDKQSVRPLHTNNIVSFDPIGKLFFTGNSKPYADAFDQAMWNRMRIIPFDNEIPLEARMDSKSETNHQQFIDDILLESSGIVNWIIEGYKLFTVNALRSVPKEVANAIAEYKQENDYLESWKQDCLNNTGKTTFNEAYKSYTQWCTENSRQPRNARRFGQDLKVKFGNPKRQYEGKEMYSFGIGVSLICNSKPHSKNEIIDFE